MTVIVEISSPFQYHPGQFDSRIMRRFWWGWFAVTFLKIPIQEYSKNQYDWIGQGA